MIKNNLLKAIKEGRKVLSSLTSTEKQALEKKWDIEHAYYSSALEGSKIDKKDFEKMAKNIS